MRTNSKTAVLSVVTGGGKWVEIWRCVQSGERPRPYGIEPVDLAARSFDRDRLAEDEINALFGKTGFSMAEVDAQALIEHAEEFHRIDARTARCKERRNKLFSRSIVGARALRNLSWRLERTRLRQSSSLRRRDLERQAKIAEKRTLSRTFRLCLD